MTWTSEFSQYSAKAPPAGGEGGAAADQVGIHRGQRRPAHRHQPLLATLAAQQHGAGRGVDVVAVQPDCFGDPSAGGVEKLQQCPVAQATRTAVCGIHLE